MIIYTQHQRAEPAPSTARGYGAGDPISNRYRADSGPQLIRYQNSLQLTLRKK